MASVVGSAIGGIGGLLGSNRAKKNAQQAAQMAQFNPFNISGAGGNVSFNGQNVNASRSNQQTQFGNAFMQNSLQNLGGGAANQGFVDFANQLGRSGIPQLFGGALDGARGGRILDRGLLLRGAGDGHTSNGEAEEHVLHGCKFSEVHSWGHAPVGSAEVGWKGAYGRTRVSVGMHKGTEPFLGIW